MELQQNVIAWLATYGMHSTLWLGTTWLVARWVRSSACRVWLWRGAVLGGLVSTALVAALATSPVAWRFEPVPEVVVAPSLPGVIVLSDVSTTELQPIEAAPSGGVPVAAETTRIAWESWLLAAWLVGALAGLVHLTCQHVRLARSLSSRRPVPEGSACAELERLCAGARVRRPKLSVSAVLASPIALARREIVVPARAFTCLDARQRAALLAHELAHLTRRDPPWLVALTVLERVLFFQPLNRLATTRSLESSELACDELAAHWTNGGMDLARCLAEVASWSTPRSNVRIATGLVERRSALMVRVDSLLSPRPARRPRVQAALTYAWLTAALATLGWAGPRVSRAQDGTAPRESGERSKEQEREALEAAILRYLKGQQALRRWVSLDSEIAELEEPQDSAARHEARALVYRNLYGKWGTGRGAGPRQDERVTAALDVLENHSPRANAYHLLPDGSLSYSAEIGFDGTFCPASHTLELRADGTIHCGNMQVYFSESHDDRLLRFHVAEIARCTPEAPATPDESVPSRPHLNVRMDERAPLYLLQRVREASKYAAVEVLQVELVPSSAGTPPFSIPVGAAGLPQELDVRLAVRVTNPFDTQTPRVVEFDVDYKVKSGTSREKLTTTQVDQLRFFLQCAHAASPERRVVLEPDTGAIYSDIMVAIEAAHEAGCTRLVLSDQRR